MDLLKTRNLLIIITKAFQMKRVFEDWYFSAGGIFVAEKIQDGN